MDLADFSRRDPAVASALELPRETATGKFRTIGLLIDLGHPEVAAAIVPELLKEKLSPADQASLVRRFGSGRFMELIQLDSPGNPTPGFAGARQFAQACLDAAAAEARNPKRLQAAVEKLLTGTAAEQYAARVDLKSGGDPAIAVLLKELASAATVEARTKLMLALVDLRPAADGPVLAVLADGQGQVRRDAAELAGYMELSAAIPQLAALAAASSDPDTAQAALASLRKLGVSTPPTQTEAQTLLRQRLAELTKGAPVYSGPGADGKGLWWSWNSQANEISSSEFTPKALRTLAAARLARTLVDAGGLVDAQDRRAILIYAWEEAALLKRPLAPAVAHLVEALSIDEISTVLADAVASDHLRAAEEAAKELGRRADPAALITVDGRPSPLAQATASGDRDLRFAALEAVMELSPPGNFPGASCVVDALWYFAAGAGSPTAVVASPVFTRASDWAAQLRSLGFDATPVGTGRDAAIAAASPRMASRLALILIDSDIGEPLVRELVYQLRAELRTSRTPIIIAASAERLADAQQIAASATRVFATPRPRNAAALKSTVESAAAMVEAPTEQAEVRQQRAEKSLAWIAQLLTGPNKLDELIRDSRVAHGALVDPALSNQAVAVLASLGTAESQTALVDFASAPSVAIADRQAAAAAFAKSVGQFGLQLTQTQLRSQYDRYNDSETADAATQKVLSQILDVIEKK